MNCKYTQISAVSFVRCHSVLGRMLDIYIWFPLPNLTELYFSAQTDVHNCVVQNFPSYHGHVVQHVVSSEMSVNEGGILVEVFSQAGSYRSFCFADVEAGAQIALNKINTMFGEAHSTIVRLRTINTLFVCVIKLFGL